MTITRSLARRVLAVSVLAGATGLLSAAALIWSVNRDTVTHSLAPLASFTFRAFELARCEAAPERYVLRIGSEIRYYAYDARTLRSHNPSAPRLDLALVRRIPRDAALQAALETFGPVRGRRLVLRVKDSGPCAYVQALVVPARPGRPALVLLAGTVAIVVVAASLGFIAIFRPLARRIARLRDAAAFVGEPTGYVAPSDRHGDELTLVGLSLDKAHARIRDDAARLEARKVELERRLADLVHDLRTPLSSLQIALEQAAEAGTDGAAKELVGVALTDAVYLSGLVSNLRLATQLNEGWDVLAEDPRVDIADTASRVCQRLAIFARHRGIALEVAVPDDPVCARCHPIAAEQAISNVVENAVAHGYVHGHVAVVLEHREGRAFELTVTDDGPGVGSHELPRLGERLFRSDEARQRDPRGSGLGLAIATAICERSGWALHFATQRPRGLCVTIRGPTASPAYDRLADQSSVDPI